MAEHATCLNTSHFQPLHPHLVGLQTRPRDGLPVTRQGSSAERIKNARNCLKTSAKPFYYVAAEREAVFTTFLTCAKPFHYVVTGRLPCRQLRGTLAFVNLPN
ncbi:hypothetical protein [Spirosoma daeguense]